MEPRRVCLVAVACFAGMLKLQVQHPGLEFYDRRFKPGAYPGTQAEPMARRHGSAEKAGPFNTD
jgi:hypothetical protein